MLFIILICQSALLHNWSNKAKSELLHDIINEHKLIYYFSIDKHLYLCDFELIEIKDFNKLLRCQVKDFKNINLVILTFK